MAKVKIIYKQLVKYCEENKCKILTSKDEYENMTGRKRISIISSCNHQSDYVRVNDFLISGKYII
jgi:hypothetical protein